MPTPNFLVKKEVEGDYQVAAPAGSKITPVVLDWVVEDSAVRSGSQGFGVAESSSKCAFASTVC